MNHPTEADDDKTAAPIAILESAGEELENALKRWLQAKVELDNHLEVLTDPDDDDEPISIADPVLCGWVMVAAYTSVELEAANSTATAYACAEGQLTPLSRGLALAGVDRWRQGH